MLGRDTSLTVPKLFCMVLFLPILLLTIQAQADPARNLQQLNQDQQFQSAYELGLKQLAEEAGRPAFDMAFGVAALESGHYDQALFSFERVLMYDRNEHLPRLELARTHFMLGNLMAARRHFNQVLEQDPPPSPAVARRIQWFLNAIDQREAGRAVATRDSVTRFYLGFRFGYDTNPQMLTDQGVAFMGRALIIPNPESNFVHELFAGASRYQLQTEKWGWFVSGHYGRRIYHETDHMREHSIDLRGGPMLLGQKWRFTLPLQVSRVSREDGNKSLVKALGAEYTYRLDAMQEYTVYGQLARIDHDPGEIRDIDSLGAGFIYSIRPTEDWRFYIGPVLGNDQALEKNRGLHYGRHWQGMRGGIGYVADELQRFDLTASYLESRHKADDPVFRKQRRDDQSAVGLKYTRQHTPTLMFDLGVHRQINDSTLDLYSYGRTQLTAGIRKEW